MSDIVERARQYLTDHPSEAESDALLYVMANEIERLRAEVEKVQDTARQWRNVVAANIKK